MKQANSIPRWAPKVPRARIQQLYTSDANGIVDEELIDEVGWALWYRCDSILTVTAAHYGHVTCPACSAVAAHPSLVDQPSNSPDSPWRDEDILHCERCGWQLPWKTYHQTYRGKQLFGANAVEVFAEYHKSFPRASSPNDKMVLIDQLIHAFHIGAAEIGRPAGANLIEGSLKEVIRFLDELSSGSRDAWRSQMDKAAWARSFLEK